MRKQLLDHGYIELVETWGSDERIVEAARMSTGKGFLGWGPLCVDCVGDSGKLVDPQPHDACTNCGNGGLMYTGDEKLLRTLYTKDHATPFEMAGAIFEVQAPIFVFREWHRHRTQSYNEMSARYTPLPDVNYMPDIDRCIVVNGTNRQANGHRTLAGELTHDEVLRWLESLRGAYAAAQEVYEYGLALGIPKEIARLPVPVARYSKMRASANLRNWMGFMTLRSAPAAQKEIRLYSDAVGDMLTDKFPRSMALWGERMFGAP